MPEKRKSLSSYIAPKYWPIWFFMGILRIICLLPSKLPLIIGKLFGRIAYHFSNSRRLIIKRNIELCFPSLSPIEKKSLVLEHFKALGMMLVEMGLGRWASDKYLKSITLINGIDHLKKAQKDGHGVILLSAHFTTLEISGRVLAAEGLHFDSVYRKNKNEFIDEIQRSGRERSVVETIEKQDIKRMVRNLRAGRTVWYAPDQSFNRKGAEVINFFGIPSMHTTAISRLAQLGNAIVIPYFPRRLKKGTYEITLLAPLTDFPSKDPIADTKKYVDLLEDRIKMCPEQYFWVHRKFKNLPNKYPNFYEDLEASK